MHNGHGGNKSPLAFRTISEASEETGIPPHVLRFWEGKFSNLRPLKRAGGRRLYRPQDVALLLGLKQLLQNEGLTIKGVQKLIRDHGIASVRDIGQKLMGEEINETGFDNLVPDNNEIKPQGLWSRLNLSDIDKNRIRENPENRQRLEATLSKLERACVILEKISTQNNAQ